LQVETAEHLVQMFRAAPLAQIHQAPAQPQIGLGPFKERPHERPQIKARATYEDGDAAPGLYITYRRRGGARIISGGKVFGWLDYVNKMMGHTLSLIARDFGRRHVYSAIDLDRVEVDYLAVHSASESYSKVAFA
jgi:hypothetical protein